MDEFKDVDKPAEALTIDSARAKLIKINQEAWTHMLSGDGNSLAQQIESGKDATYLLGFYDIGVPVAVGHVRPRREFTTITEQNDPRNQEYLFGFNGLSPTEVQKLVGTSFHLRAQKAIDEKRGNGSIQPIADLDLGEGVVYHSVVYDVGKTGHPDYQPGYGYATVPRVAETGQSAKKMIDSAISILKNPPQASAKT